MTPDLQALINGFRVSQAIHVAAALGIADLLADGARSSSELAEATQTDEDALYRVLRALAAVGVLHEKDGRRFTTTETGDALRGDGAGWAAFVGRPYIWNAWAHLLDTVRTGENAFRLLHGSSVWEYRAEHPEESGIFDRAMRTITQGVNRALLDAYDFGRFGVVVDVGGGDGTLLAALLDAYPQLEGVLFDQPHVIASAAVPARCRVVAGSFFESVPEGADAYVLKSIVHDWEDADAVRILRTVRAGVPPHGVVLLVERDLGAPNEAPAAKLLDLTMLVAAGGRERTIEEYERLLTAAGFRLAGVTPTAAGVDVIEARLEA